MKKELLKGKIKVIEVKENSIYIGKLQRKNGIFYKTNTFNAKNLEDAMKHMKYLYN